MRGASSNANQTACVLLLIVDKFVQLSHQLTVGIVGELFLRISREHAKLFLPPDESLNFIGLESQMPDVHQFRSVFEFVVNDAEISKPSKTACHFPAFEVLVCRLMLAAEVERPFVSLFGRIGTDKDQIAVNYRARVGFDADLFNKFRYVPFGVGGYEWHSLKMRAYCLLPTAYCLLLYCRGPHTAELSCRW